MKLALLLAAAALHWSSIVWEPWLGKPHAELLVEARLNGRGSGLLQLDLGTWRSVLYGPGGTDITVSGSVAGREFQGEPFGFRGDAAKPGRLGTLGLSFFAQRVLILDFVNGRLAILGKGEQLPADLERRFQFVPMRVDRGLLLVAGSVNGRTFSHLAFDTGSSVIPFATGQALWRQLTGREIDDPRNLSLQGSSWEREVELIGAPVESLCVAGSCLPHPLIYCFRSPPANLDFDKANGISGVVGNVVFDGRYTVVVDVARGRLGLLRAGMD